MGVGALTDDCRGGTGPEVPGRRGRCRENLSVPPEHKSRVRLSTSRDVCTRVRTAREVLLHPPDGLVVRRKGSVPGPVPSSPSTGNPDSTRKLDRSHLRIHKQLTCLLTQRKILERILRSYRTRFRESGTMRVTGSSRTMSQ